MIYILYNNAHTSYYIYRYVYNQISFGRFKTISESVFFYWGPPTNTHTHTRMYTHYYTHITAMHVVQRLPSSRRCRIQRHTPGDSDFDGWRLMTVNANSRAFPKDGQRVIDFPRAAYAETNECAPDIACVTRIYIGMRRRIIIIIIILYYDDVEKEGNIFSHGRGSLTTSRAGIGLAVSHARACVY